MILSFNLSYDMPCDKICKGIQKLVMDYRKTNPNSVSPLLVISIKETIDGGDDHIPKIEFKPDNEWE